METKEMTMPRLAPEGEPCASCSSPLTADQRYCLNCGHRRGEARLPYANYLPGTQASGAELSSVTVTATDAPERQNEVSPLGAVFGVALLGAMLLMGVLLGRGGDEQQAAAPPIVQVGDASTATPGAGAAETVSNEKVVSEWPKGKEGFTIELGTLPKNGTTSTDVDAIKADLESKGATELGVLDSDLYPSLPGGNYVVYSGEYDSKSDASSALKSLSSDFTDAAVIEVSSKSPGGGSTAGGAAGSDPVANDAATEQIQQESADDIAALEAATGDDYQEQVANGPDQIATPGEPPPIDTSGPVGGGTDAEVIE